MRPASHHCTMARWSGGCNECYSYGLYSCGLYRLAYIGMAYIGMAYIVLACIVMVYIVMVSHGGVRVEVHSCKRMPVSRCRHARLYTRPCAVCTHVHTQYCREPVRNITGNQRTYIVMAYISYGLYSYGLHDIAGNQRTYPRPGETIKVLAHIVMAHIWPI